MTICQFNDSGNDFPTIVNDIITFSSSSISIAESVNIIPFTIIKFDILLTTSKLGPEILTRPLFKLTVIVISHFHSSDFLENVYGFH